MYDIDVVLPERSLLNMSKQLNVLEKEFLIKRFKEQKDIKIVDFCTVNGISITAFKKWLKVYNEEGIEGLNRGKNRHGKDNPPILPEGIDSTEENYKREILKLRIENERLKKNYTVQTNEAGETIFVRLKDKNLKS